MRILQLTAYYPPSIGGIQVYVRSLSEQLQKQGCEVDILTVNTDGATSFEEQNGLSIRRCQLDKMVYRAVLSKEFNQRLLAAKNYDAYHIHIPFHIGLEVAAYAAKKNRIPLIATHHGQGLKGSLVYSLSATTYSWFSRLAPLLAVDRMIFLTRSYANEIWLPQLIRRKTHIVRTGTNLAAFSPQLDGTAVRQRYNLSANAPLLLFVGSLHQANRYKGVDYLLQALVQIRQSLPESRLVVVGSGELLPELQELARSLKLDDCVTFAGAIENSQLPHYYAAADALVLPSIRGPENAPVVVFEAMASGKAVVASDLPGVREIVEHEKTGLLSKPRDIPSLAAAITRVLEDKGFRKQAGLAARQRAESFSWEHCASHMKTHYQEVIAS